MIFDETTLRKLNQLALVASKVRAGVLKGERRSTKRGTSIEFAGYRDYTPGDDLRRLDWNVYARLERPFIKLIEEEEDLAVNILVDASKSMDWGEDALHKFQYALKLAAALGSVALGAGDYLTVTLLHAAQAPAQYGPARGQQHLMRLLAFLEPQTCDGTTDLNQMLRDYTLAARRPGLTFLISDLFSPAGFETGLNQLQSRGYELTLVHLLAPDELEPPLAGDLRLIDIETDFGQDVSLDAGLRELYRRRLQAWQNEIQLLCGKRGIRYLPVSTAYPWDELVLLDFRKAGIVK